MEPQRPDIFKPIKPNVVTQAWGVHDPAVYSQFGLDEHNGLDNKLALDRKMYAPFLGQIVRAATKENGQW